MNVEGFVAAHLAQRGSRVLEVGCGAGDLARSLARKGYKVTAIDPRAPDGPIFRKVALEEFEDPVPFHGVVANTSLHHVEELSAALAKIESLLEPGGKLILNEFAWEQMDDKTAEWYVSQTPGSTEGNERRTGHDFLNAWNTEHHGLHDSVTMRRALDDRFRSEVFEWGPYLAYELKRVDLIEEEITLIGSGEINPIGFRYVGTPL